MRLPARLHVTWQDDTTLKVEVDNGNQVRLFRFDKSTQPSAQPDWPGSGAGCAGPGWYLAKALSGGTGMRVILGLTLAATVLFSQNAEPDLKAGKAVFNQWCGTCHGEGRYMAGTNGLRAKYKNEKPALLEQRTDLTPPEDGNHRYRAGVPSSLW